MKVSSYAYQNTYTVGGLYNSNLGKFYIEFGRMELDLDLTAKGVGRATEEIEDEYEYHLVPFQAGTYASRENYDFKMIYANMLFNNPFGLKFRYISKSSDVPSGYIQFDKENVSYETPHLTWGWSKSGCNHIFGYSHINTDAWYQNYYILYDGYQMDLQLSYEFNGNFKTGFRYRRNRDNGDMYEWEYDDGSDFDGDYYVDEFWNHHKLSDLFRGYSKVRFWRIGNLDLGMLLFLEYKSSSPLRLMNKMTESDPANEAREKEFIIETNPFFNYTFNRGYIDFGVLLEYSRTGMNNVSPRWNPVSRSDQKDVLWNTSPNYGWSQPWEFFSKGNAWFFATGFEMYSSITVVKNLSLLESHSDLREKIS